MDAPKETFGLRMYRALSHAAGPVADYALKKRLRAGKEDTERVGERRGITNRERPEGQITWIHGASVGESLSVIPLAERILDAFPQSSVLVTTGTVTSAKLMQARLPDGAFHQFAPIDHPAYVQSFLDHWRPDAALFVESEFWPNMIRSTRAVTPFMALVNGRISPKSFNDWKSQPNTIKYILSSFDVILAQDQQNRQRLDALGERSVQCFGNLKNAAPPPAR